MDLERCLERPIGLGVNSVASEVLGAASAKGLGGTSPLRARTWPTLLLIVGGWRGRAPP